MDDIVNTNTVNIIRKIALNYSSSNGSADINLDDRSLPLRRYKRNIRHKDFTKLLGPKLAPHFDILYDITKDDSVLYLAQILHKIERSEWFNLLTEISAYAKQHGSSFSPNWENFVNIELACGYYEAAPDKDLYERVREWVSQKTFTPKDDQLFVDEITSVLKNLFRDIPIDHLLPREFARNRNNWATSGSSQTKALFDIDGKRASRSKWATALSLTDDEIHDMLFKVDRAPLVASEVQGPGKSRIIISSGDILHIQMSYISRLIERSLHTKLQSISSLFFTNTQTVNMFFDTLNTLSSGTIFFCPIDQSSFDANQPKSHVIALLNVIKSVVPSYAKPVMDNIIYSVISSSVRVGDKLIPYQNGVLSGWRWTALIGTLLNYASAQAICNIHGIMTLNNLFQGDDVSCISTSVTDIDKLIKLYEYYGYVVNPKKFWLSTKRHEYLRRLYKPNTITGYVNRSIFTILWYKPQNIDSVPDLITDLRSICNNWSTLCGRARIPTVERMFKIGFLEDMLGRVSNRLPKQTVIDWIMTPSTFGGAGFDTSGRTALRVKAEKTYLPISGYRHDSSLSYIDQQKYIRSRANPRPSKQQSQIVVETVKLPTLSKTLVPDTSLTTTTLLRRPHIQFNHYYDTKLSDEQQFAIDMGLRDFTLSYFDNVYRPSRVGRGTTILDRIRRTGSLRVIKMLTSGNLEPTSPNIIGSNSIILSQISSYVSSLLMKNLMIINRVSFSLVQAYRFSAEVLIRSLYVQYVSNTGYHISN